MKNIISSFKLISKNPNNAKIIKSIQTRATTDNLIMTKSNKGNFIIILNRENHEQKYAHF